MREVAYLSLIFTEFFFTSIRILFPLGGGVPGGGGKQDILKEGELSQDFHT